MSHYNNFDLNAYNTNYSNQHQLRHPTYDPALEQYRHSFESPPDFYIHNNIRTRNGNNNSPYDYSKDRSISNVLSYPPMHRERETRGRSYERKRWDGIGERGRGNVGGVNTNFNTVTNWNQVDSRNPSGDRDSIGKFRRDFLNNNNNQNMRLQTMEQRDRPHYYTSNGNDKMNNFNDYVNPRPNVNPNLGISSNLHTQNGQLLSNTPTNASTVRSQHYPGSLPNPSNNNHINNNMGSSIAFTRNTDPVYYDRNYTKINNNAYGRNYFEPKNGPNLRNNHVKSNKMKIGFPAVFSSSPNNNSKVLSSNVGQQLENTRPNGAKWKSSSLVKIPFVSSPQNKGQVSEPEIPRVIHTIEDTNLSYDGINSVNNASLESSLRSNPRSFRDTNGIGRDDKNTHERRKHGKSKETIKRKNSDGSYTLGDDWKHENCMTEMMEDMPLVLGGGCCVATLFLCYAL